MPAARRSSIARWRSLAAAQEESAGRRTQLDRTQADLAAARAETARRQTQLDQALAALTAAREEAVRRPTQPVRTQSDPTVAQAESARRQAQLDRSQVDLLAQLAMSQRLSGDIDAGLRLAVHAARLGLRLNNATVDRPSAPAVLAALVWQSDWRLMLHGHAAAFSPDGLRLVTAASDDTARVWDAANGKEIAVLRGHQGGVNSVAFTPDGTRIVTASDDGTARIWDAATGAAGGDPRRPRRRCEQRGLQP